MVMVTRPQKFRGVKRARQYGAKSSVAKRPRTFGQRRVTYDRRVIESPSVGLGQGARTRIRTFQHVQVVLGATGKFAGYLKPGSAFDPFGDIGIVQPNLFDTWKSVYSRYLVISARIKISIGSQVGTGNSGTLVAYPSLNSTAKTTLQDAASQPYAKTTLYHGAGSDPKPIYFNLDHLNVLGKWGPLESLANGAATNSDPITGQFMVLPIFYQSALASSTSGNLTMEIEMTQDVWFDQRKNVDDIIE